MRIWLVFISLAMLPAAMLDAVAVSVGTQAVTERQISQEIRLAAFTNNSEPDLSTGARRKAANQLVEQALIRREMSFGTYPPVPEARIDSGFASTEKARGGETKLNAQLEHYRLTSKELRDYIAWQLQLLNFIDLRFRPAVQVTDEDVEKYYRENLAAIHPTGAPLPALKDVHDEIQQKLTGERVDQQLDQWIARSRARAIVRYIDPTLGTTSNAAVHVETGQGH